MMMMMYVRSVLEYLVSNLLNESSRHSGSDHPQKPLHCPGDTDWSHVLIKLLRTADLHADITIYFYEF